MAETILIELDIETGEATSNLNKVDQSVENIGESAKKTQKSTKSFGKTLGNLGKAAGIVGLLTAAFEVLQEALGNNQKVVDTLATATTALGIAFNDLFGFISDNLGTVVNFFKEAFENPSKLLSDFADAIKNNIEVRIKALIKTFGLLGDTVSKIFEGDFSGALDSASEAAETYVDVLTGVEGTVDKVVEGVTDLVDATTDYVTETYQAAEAVTELTKSSRLLELQQTRIREQYDRDAEQLRQIRDDENKSIEERIEANRQLGEVLNQQQELEQQTVKDRIAALQFQQEQLGVTQERIEEIYELETELIAIEAQQAGFRSEQLINEQQLIQEKADLEQQAIDERIEAEQRAADQQAKIDAKAKKKAEQDAAESVKIKEAEEQAKVDIAASAVNAIASFSEEGSAIGKAAAVAATIIDTWRGAQSAFANTAGGIVIKSAAAAIAVGVGLANVKKILQTKTPGNKQVSGATVSASGTAPATSTATAPPPSFNTQQDTGQNQLAEDISNAINDRPIKTYVVSQDVTNAQQLDRVTLNNATL